jgi:hypothetical protein
MSISAPIAVVADKIWTQDRPVWYSGIRQRARTTIVRLEDGGLLVHSPAPPTDALVEQLRALGSVRWLVVPNCFHHLGTPAAAARFSEAQVVGPASAVRRNKALKLDLDINDAKFGEQIPELQAMPLRGVPFLDETVLYHRSTQTLLGADIVLCANAKDHWTCRVAARMTGFYERVRVPPDVRASKIDKSAAARSLATILQRPAQRLIVGHSDVIEGDCCDHLARAWRLKGVDV